MNAMRFQSASASYEIYVLMHRGVGGAALASAVGAYLLIVAWMRAQGNPTLSPQSELTGPIKCGVHILRGYHSRCVQ